MPAGRPTKYGPAMCDKVREYIENYKDHGDVIPQIASLAGILGVTSSTLYKWEGEYQEFSEMLGNLRDAQHKSLINGGIDG